MMADSAIPIQYGSNVFGKGHLSRRTSIGLASERNSNNSRQSCRQCQYDKRIAFHLPSVSTGENREAGQPGLFQSGPDSFAKRGRFPQVTTIPVDNKGLAAMLLPSNKLMPPRLCEAASWDLY